MPDPYAELRPHDDDEPAAPQPAGRAPSDAASRPAERTTSPAERPHGEVTRSRTMTIPEWVIPAPPPSRHALTRRVATKRGWRFALVLVAWIAVFHVAPVYVVWSTSPVLRDAVRHGGIHDYLKPPSCAVTARALGNDPSLCSQASFRARFDAGTQTVRAERDRNIRFAGFAWLAVAIATLVVVMAAGLSLWWWFAIFVNPLSLIVQGWALWRIAGVPRAAR